MFEKKIELIRDRMLKEKISIVFLSPGPNFYWLFDFCPLPDERPCFACLTLDKLLFLVPELNKEQLKRYVEYPYYLWLDEDGPTKAFEKLIANVGKDVVKQVAVEETMRADFLLLIQEVLPDVLILSSKSTLGYLRMFKTISEFDKLKKSAGTADKAMREAFINFSTDLTEAKIGSIIDRSFYLQGAKPAFSLVASGSNGAFPHHHSSDKKIQRGNSTLVDIGASYNGYYSDITRMVYLGKPSERYIMVHNIVEEALSVAIKSVAVGIFASSIDDAARMVIEKAGFGDFFIHRTGHGGGLESHEAPYITRNSNFVLEEGMVFTIEPGIYLPGEFGVRLEEVIYLSSSGPVILSELNRDLVIID